MVKIVAVGDVTGRHPPSQLISTTTEMSSPSTMSITYKNLGRIKTWI